MIVLDASTAISIVLGLDSGKAVSALQDPGETIAAPRLFCAEIAHVLGKYVKGGYISSDEIARCSADALALIDIFADDEDLATEVLTESLRLKHSTYDLFYFVLARRLGATLFTLDKKLQNICIKGNVNCIYTASL